MSPTARWYQDKCSEFAKPSAHSLQYLIPGLCAEAGEVADKYAKYIRDEQWQPFGGLIHPTEAILKEVGDVLWFCAMLCNYYDASLADVMEANIAKLEDRKARDVIGGSGDDR